MPIDWLDPKYNNPEARMQAWKATQTPEPHPVPLITTTLPVTLTLHLEGTACHTTSALSDPPRPEVQTLSIESISLEVTDRVEGLDGVAAFIPREVDLTAGLNPASGNLGMFLNRLLDALGQEADDALLEEGE